MMTDTHLKKAARALMAELMIDSRDKDFFGVILASLKSVRDSAQNEQLPGSPSTPSGEPAAAANRDSDHLRFGDWVTNPQASESNPTKRGRFVRHIRRRGRMNPGHWLGIRVEALRVQEAQYDSPRTIQKHTEVSADLNASRKELAEFDAAYPEHLRRMHAETWASMRPGRRIEDYPGEDA